MAIPLLAIAAAAQIPKFVAGISQTRKANKALAELAKQKFPEYTDDPRFLNAYNRAEAMTRYGYTPEERAAFEQQMGRARTDAFVQATDMSGGNMGQAIQNVLQANQLDSINKFAASDASLRRENIRYADTLAEALQRQRNLQTQSAIARRQALEQMYGQAKSSGLSNTYGALAGVGAMAFQSALGSRNAGTTVEQPEMMGPDEGEFKKYDKKGNPTLAYLNSPELAPENVLSEEELKIRYPELYE